MGLLRSKKQAIINGDNNIQNALDDALNYQTIEKEPQKILKLNPYINILISIIEKGWNFRRNQKTGKNVNEIIR